MPRGDPRSSVETYTDHRTNSNVVRVAFEVTEEALEHRAFNMLGRSRSSMYIGIGDELSRGPVPQAVFSAWAQMRSSNDAPFYNRQDPCHMAGLMLLYAREECGDAWEQLCNFDPACRVELECTRNVMRYSVELYITVRIPMNLAYRGGARTVEYRQPFDPEPQRYQISTPSRADPQFERMAQQIQTSPWVETTLPPLPEDVPQGELAPRKTKRVSVATNAPGPEAESPRRLKLRRDREN